MADSASGWHTVLPTSLGGMGRLERDQRVALEKQAIALWAASEGHWSGVGKHINDSVEAKKVHHKIKQSHPQDIGVGGQGSVQLFNYSHKSKPISLARKRVYYQRRVPIEILREEANVLERLSHEHIVHLVGTYTYQPREIHLILWPAAVCDLSKLLVDLDDLRYDGGDRDDILERLGNLELSDTSALEGNMPSILLDSSSMDCPLQYLRHIMGCITQAVMYCHASKVRHLDLKPQNILLCPGRVYLTDFGISRDVNDQDHTRTHLENGSRKWFSPERLNPQDDWSMQTADIYSLGLVFSDIATVLYNGKQSDLFDILEKRDRDSRIEALAEYHEQLKKYALVLQEYADETANTYGPKHIVSLITRMLSPEATKRPSAAMVNEDLITLGGIQQIYHSPCCKAATRPHVQLLDRKFAQVCEERRRFAEENERLAKRLQALSGMDETYETRLENERRQHAKDRANLQKQLDEERRQKKELEAQLRELEQGRRPRPPMSRQEHSISGGLTMKPPRHPHSPNQRHVKPVTVQPLNVNLPKSPTAVPAPPHTTRRPEPDLRKSTDSLTNFPMRSRGSGSRLPQPVNPSTPIRSSTPLDLTDSTIDSIASSMFSTISRRTTGTGISPVPTTSNSPSASKILGAPPPIVNIENSSGGFEEATTVNGSVGGDAARGEFDTESIAGTSEHDVPLAGTAPKSPDTTRIPPLPVAKSWAAVAGDKQGLASMIGAAVGKKKKH